MKRTIAVFMVLFIICTFAPAYASNDISDVYVFGPSCTNVSSFTVTPTNEVQLWGGHAAGYDIYLPYQATELELIFNTGSGFRGSLEIRLDTWDGETIGRLDTTQLSGEWTNVKHTIKLSKPISGNVKLWILCVSGCHFIAGFNLNQIDPNAPVRTFNSPVLTFAFTDISEEANADRITLLAELGIIPTDSAQFLPDSPITRKEYVEMIGRIISAERYYDGYMPFADIDPQSEDAKILGGLYKLGVIRGGTDGKFDPNRFITPQEAATVCTNALGYSFLADTYVNAIKIATQLKLLSGIDVSNPYLTKSHAAKMIFALLLCDYLDGKEYSDDRIVFEPEKNFMEAYSPYIYGEGTVTGNYDTKLYFPVTDNHAITIDGVNYEAGASGAASYLGVLCEYFYTEQDGKKVIVAIRPSRNVTIKQFCTSPDVSFEAINENKITVYDKNKEYNYNIVSSTAIIYNGIALDTSLGAIIDPHKFMGKITLIDNDSDNKPDCVLIDEAQSVLIETIRDNFIKDKLTGDMIDTDDGVFDLFIGGKAEKIKSLQSGDVLTVYRSVNKTGDKLTRAVLSTDFINGTVTEVTGDEVRIGNNTYTKDAMCTDDIYPGLYADFYLNEYGMIVTSSKDVGSDRQVGLLLAKGEDGSGIDKEYKAKLLTEQGVSIYSFAERVTADGVKIKGNDQLQGGKDSFAGLAYVENETPVIFRTDAEGKITVIDTVMHGADNKDDQLKQLGDAVKAYGAFSVLINVNKWIPETAYKSDTKFITLTEDGDEKNYSIKTGFTHVTDDNTTTVIPYTTDKDSFVADILLSKNYAPSENDRWRKPFIFDHVSEITDAEGENALCLYGYSFGGPVSYKVDMEYYSSGTNMSNIISSVRPGDILWPKVFMEKVVDLELTYLYDNADVNGSGIAPAIKSPDYASPTNKGGPTLSRVNILDVEGDFINTMSDASIAAGSNLTIPFSTNNLTVATCKVLPNGNISVEYGLPGSSLFSGEKALVYAADYTIYGAFVYTD